MGRHRAPGAPHDRGTVTAETAVLLPTLVLLLALLLGVLGHGVTQSMAIDASRTGARLLARGEPEPEVRRAALRQIPPGSTVELRRAGAEVVVVVTVPGRVLPGGLRLPSVRAESVWPAEPSVSR